MKKNILFSVILSAIIMLLLPWLAVTFARSDAGMVVVFLLFYGVNPIYSICTGIYAGKDAKHLWSLPMITAAFFLIGVWSFFDREEILFVMYAGVYLTIGIIAMGIRFCYHKICKK